MKNDNFELTKLNYSNENFNDLEKNNNKCFEIYQTKILKIPYFYHGNILNFYFPYTKVTSEEFKYPIFCIGKNKKLFPIIILIISMFFSFVYYILNKFIKISNNFLKNIILIILIVSFIISIILYLINPGIIYQSYIKNIQNTLYCKICDIKYDKSLNGKHCQICNVCISGFDHHCNSIGKCIGRYNFIIFYIVILFMGFLQWIYLYHIGKFIYYYFYNK